MCKFCHAKVLVNFRLTVQFIQNSSLDLDTLLVVVMILHNYLKKCSAGISQVSNVFHKNGRCSLS